MKDQRSKTKHCFCDSWYMLLNQLLLQLMILLRYNNKNSDRVTGSGCYRTAQRVQHYYHELMNNDEY